MKAQGNNIFFTVVEWWNRKRNDLNPVIQVLTELPLFHEFLEVPVCCRD